MLRIQDTTQESTTLPCPLRMNKDILKEDSGKYQNGRFRKFCRWAH